MKDRFSKSKYRVPFHSNDVVNRRGARRKERLSGRLVNMDSISTYDPAAENDTSYRDALFDSSLRQSIKIEYGSIKPPPGVLSRVQRAIEQDASETVGSVPQRVRVLGNALLCLRSTLSRQLTGKLLPSAIAIVLALGISITATTYDQVRNGSRPVYQSARPEGSALTSNAFATQAPQLGQMGITSPGPGTVDIQAGDYSALYGGGSIEVDQYDLHTPPKKPGDNYRTRNEVASLGR